MLTLIVLALLRARRRRLRALGLGVGPVVIAVGEVRVGRARSGVLAAARVFAAASG